MDKVLDVLLDAVIDTLKIVPILLLVYFLIEFLEYKNIMQFEKSKTLKGKASPIFGSLFGSLPQCGFSVISTDLYTKGFISIGALMSVYIATSDEALPIMISNPDGWLPLLLLILCKIILGIVVGYLAILIYPKIFKTKNIHLKVENQEHKHENVVQTNKVLEDANIDIQEDEHIDEIKHEHIGCCKHVIADNKFDWKHPLLHCLKIALFILIVNLIFGAIIAWIGGDKLTDFLSQSSVLQPILAILIGLIPNCASSVVITELYLLGGLSFGSVLAGLSVNAGLGLMILFKQDKNIKEIVFILSMLIIPSLIAGYALHFIPMPF